jgi:hypothetical protein
MYETTPSRKEATSTRCCPDERTGPRAPLAHRTKWIRVATTTSGKEWCHPKAAFHRFRTSRQGFLPKIHTHNPRTIRCKGYLRGRSLTTTELATQQHVPPWSSRHHRRLLVATVTRPARQCQKAKLESGPSSSRWAHRVQRMGERVLPRHLCVAPPRAAELRSTPLCP